MSIFRNFGAKPKARSSVSSTVIRSTENPALVAETLRLRRINMLNDVELKYD